MPMDKFVTITKSTTGRVPSSNDTKGSTGGMSKRPFKYNPYPIPKAKERQVEAWRGNKRTAKILAPLRKEQEEKTRPASSKALTKHLLNTLKDSSNPITHSTIGQRTDHVDSCATGHQRSDARRSSSFFNSRNKKLEEQRLEKGKDTTGVLDGVKIYIGGYMAGTTDIEMKRIVSLAGGQIMHTAAGATHVLTSQTLSGAKAQKHLHGNTRNKVHVIKPQWVSDSIAAGKRKKEWDYTVIKDSTVYDLKELGIKPAHKD